MDARLIIDSARCHGTGVCVSITPGHVQLMGDTATIVDGTASPLSQARLAASCCPNDAITVADSPEADHAFRVPSPIVTLGPEATDAHAEACKHASDVRLVDSFAEAMRVAAHGGGARALVAAGYLALDGSGRVADSWVDQHFTYTGVLRLQRCWESTTKPMCFAVRRDAADPTAVVTIATHPATRVYASRYARHARQIMVHAKPLAARAAAHREVDACIASVDVVARYPQLEVIEQFQPSMVWLLYVKEGTDA